MSVSGFSEYKIEYKKVNLHYIILEISYIIITFIR